MAKFGHFFLFLVLLAASQAANRVHVERGRYYQIKSADESVLTIGGANSRGVRVITEIAQGTDPRQKFILGTGNTHEIKAEQQNAYSALVLDLDLNSGLVYQELRYYKRNQWWRVTPLDEENKYAIQNDKNGHCMTSDGINTQVYASLCNLGNANQTWIFTAV